MRRLIITAVIVTFGILAPSAMADTVGLSVSASSPEQGIPLTITVSGSATAIDASADGPYLYAVARPAGGVGCQSSFGADQEAAGPASTLLIDGDEQHPGAFSEQASFDPDQGGSVICAWLESDAYDGEGSVATPDEVVAGPATTSFTAAKPQVGALKVSVPAEIVVNQAYNITYATQTDQDLELDSIVIPASANGCAGSYELAMDDANTTDDIFDGSQDVYGTASTKGIDTETATGSYTICSWLEGPDVQQVDATNATPITVLAASSSTGSGGGTPPSSGSNPTTPVTPTTATACVVPKYAGTSLATIKQRLITAHCGVGEVHRIRSAKVRAGRVVKLSAAAGKKLAHGTRVAIFVAGAEPDSHFGRITAGRDA